MFTKKLEDQFSADLLNTVKGILGEAKKCSKDCKCEKCEKEDDEKGEKEEKGEMKEANLTGLPKSTAEKNKQYIEITHLLGHKRRVPVHPTNAYKALNRYRKDPSTKSARIVSEDLEQIDELSAKKLGQYISATVAKGKEERKKRAKGVTTAVDKMSYPKGSPLAKKVPATEEVQIDELSKKTLGSYVKRAAGHVGAEGLTAGLKIKSGENPMKNLNKALKRQKGIETATNKLTKEDQDFIDSLNNADIEQIDELSLKTLDNYRTKARKEIIDAGANDDNRLYNKRVKGYRAASKAAGKKFAKEEVELEEGRGRPPKEGSPAWHAKQKQADDDMVALGMQLRKAKSMNKKVRFMNGKEHHVSPHHADKFEDHMAARKTSQEKAAFQKQAHKSHEDFVKAVSAPVPKASKDTGEIVKYRH